MPGRTCSGHTETMDVEVRPLAPANFPALEELFREGGDPSWCWCMAFRIPASEGGRARREANHQRLRALVEQGPEIAPGLVAFQDDRAVGWVSVGPRQDYVRLQRSRVYAPVDDTPVWSVVCFVVSRSARGRGLMHTLLRAAIDYARDHGATVLEAYPPDTGDQRLPAAYGYAGTQGLYQQAGFEAVATRRATRTATPRLTMRLDLTPR